MVRQRRTHLNRPPSAAIQPPAQLQPQPAPRRRRKPQNHWVMPWILHRQEKECYSNLLADLIHRNPSYQNFVRMPPAFDRIEERIHHCIKKSVTNLRKPLEVGLKLAITLRHIAMKKPEKTSSDYYNYRGFFFLVPLALVDAEYRFLWIDFGSSGSCSDAQISNRSL